MHISTAKALCKLVIFLSVFVIACDTKERKPEESNRKEKATSFGTQNKYNWAPMQKLALEEVQRIVSESASGEVFFATIHDIEIDSRGNIYLLDPINYRVVVFSEKGKFMHFIGGMYGKGPGEFVQPRAMSIDTSGLLYIADSGTRRINVMNQSGLFMKSVNVNGIIADIIARNQNEVYFICFMDAGPSLIHKINVQMGKTVHHFCEAYQITAQVAMTGDAGRLTMACNGQLIYSFAYPYCIRFFSAADKLVHEISASHDFFNPPKKDKRGAMVSVGAIMAIAVTPDNKIVTAVKHRKFDSGEVECVLDFFDSAGRLLQSVPGKNIDLVLTKSIAIDSKGYLYIAYDGPMPHLRKFKITFDR